VTPDPRARRGVWIFLAALVPLTALVEGLILGGVAVGPPVVRIGLLMAVPAVASVIARVIGREGFGDLSFGLDRRATALAVAFPVAVAALAYGIGWGAGLVALDPPLDTMAWPLPAWIVATPGSPAARLAAQLAIHVTVAAVAGCLLAVGEEVGWRGYLQPRLTAAGVRAPAVVTGLVWAAWHWPLFFRGGLHLDLDRGLEIALFTADVVLIAIAMARLCARRGSVLPAIVLHGVWNEVLGGVCGPATVDEGHVTGEAGVLVVAAVVALLPALWWATRAGDAARRGAG
jgi:membrane protease YdiL (CAAX protease family)